eukprot:TRINITY_DN2208_c0_g1_i1.p1 TRINITY_DN2208_c0_g1~~TRINITY_DN2208_c0_g1_i1.p1  ORF type:complete len:106 (+),score=17.17 TRINITY_DN2208_c0_g1_i1:220-537(+)
MLMDRLVSDSKIPISVADFYSHVQNCTPALAPAPVPAPAAACVPQNTVTLKPTKKQMTKKMPLREDKCIIQNQIYVPAPEDIPMDPNWKPIGGENVWVQFAADGI